MKKIIFVSLFIISFSISAKQFKTEHRRTPQALKSALESVKKFGGTITALQYTRQNQWILVAGKRRWYSNAAYFQNLKGSGNKGLRQVLEPIMRDSTKHVNSLTIGEDGNWIILLRGGTFRHSSRQYFENNGLAARVRQIRQAGALIAKVYLGPKKSWIIGDNFGRLYSKGLPVDLYRLIKSIEESKLRLLNLNFSFKGDGKFYYVLSAGGHFWKSGAPGTPLWRSLIKLQKSESKISKVALKPNGDFTIVSQFKSRPGMNDILGHIEQAVGGMNIWERMRHHKVPGVSIALVRKGKIVDVRPYGWRRRDKWNSVNNKTLFSVASISKAVGSAGIMKAVEEGRIDLDKSVYSAISKNSSLSTTRNWYSSFSDEIRRSLIRQAPFHSLLDHTSGFGVHGIGLYIPSRLPSLKDIIMGKGSRVKVKPQWIPNTRWLYSGGAFSIAESITEQTYNQKFSTYMRNKILRPGGMTNSTFGRLSANQKKNYAFGHRNNKRLSYKECPGKAAGGLFTTSKDYAKFLSTLMNLGKAPNGRQVLQRSSVRRMMTPGHSKSSALNACVRDSECSIVDGEKCYFKKCRKPILNGGRHSGLGLKLHTKRLINGLPATISHGGSQKGFSSHFNANLRVGYGIVILTNGDCKWNASLPGGKTEKRGGCYLTNEIKNAFYKRVFR